MKAVVDWSWQSREVLKRSKASGVLCPVCGGRYELKGCVLPPHARTDPRAYFRRCEGSGQAVMFR